MKLQAQTKVCSRKDPKKIVSAWVCLWLVVFGLVLSGCNELEKSKTEPFYAQTAPPPKQEFRWSNGKMPKSLDPSQASAAPETDIVRALYEGLTDTDSQTLQPIPAAAAKWTASEDFKTWIFTLRRDAKWSNGEAVTARDFARSWKRLVELGDKVPQRQLLKNIVGMDTENAVAVFSNQEIDILSKANSEKKETGRITTSDKLPDEKQSANENEIVPTNENEPRQPPVKVGEDAPKTEKEVKKKDRFGVKAINDFTLKVSLIQPDKDFPALVAHPVFRPVHDGGKEFETNGLNPDVITNGAFRVSAIGRDGVTLDRAEYYWNVSAVELERVSFVAMESAENALAAYRAGELDAVTNADFKPLALKLLTPYDDFRRTTHGALNFYEFNSAKPPFNDSRVRRALATAIERERLTEDEMDGLTRPALSFSPFGGNDGKLLQDVAAAQKLLAESGFAGGRDFPTVRLLINRNDIQRRIARAVAKMWKKNLNIETEIIIKDGADFDGAFQNGEFDVARRGIVLSTTDETANMLAMFPSKPAAATTAAAEAKDLEIPSQSPAVSNNGADNSSANNQILSEKSAESNLDFSQSKSHEAKNSTIPPPGSKAFESILTENQALESLPGIPLYFPTSYSLVKPYVQGFETNALDAPALKDVKINNHWQPANQKVLSKDQN